MSSEGGNAVDARRVDDGLLHVGGSATKGGAQLRSDGVARAVHKGETGVRSAGGLVSSSAEPQRGSKERAPRNKPASLQASASPALEQTSHSRASVPQNEREVDEALQIGREMAEGGSTVDARRGDGGSLHSGERECCLLVLNLVSSTLPCIRQPRPRLRVLDICGFVLVCTQAFIGF